MLQDNYINLGKTGIQISSIGIGIMQWGDFRIDPSDTELNKKILEIYQVVLASSINLFDTAEMYGNGKSELHLGDCLRQIPSDVVIATKFMPFPWRITKGELRSALSRSLKRLGLSHVDLYQMHWPTPPVPIRSWMDAMADVVADGLIRAVGVSNYSVSQTRLAHEALAKHNITLASNQVRFSLLHQTPVRNGLLKLCNELGITIIAYSPLEKGILSGKYSSERLPTGYRSMFYNKNYLHKIAPLMEALKQIGQAHDEKTSAQVALNWLTCKGAVPIPGARDQQQARENAGGLGWQLTAGEIALLDRISEEVTE